MTTAAAAAVAGVLTLERGRALVDLDLRSGRVATVVASRDAHFGYLEPAWSRQGRLAYVRVDARCNRCIVTFVRGARGDRPVSREGDSEDPRWSPDGRLLAFVEGGALGGAAAIAPALYVARPDGSHLRLVARGEDPAWAPDGRLAFTLVDVRDPSRTRVCVTRAYAPTRTCVGAGSEPTWSPTGRLAYAGPRGLVVGGTTIGTAAAALPVWSPDGRRIAYVNRTRRANELWVATPGGRARRVPGSATSTRPVWAPNGRFLAVGDGATTRILDVDGRVVRRVRGAVGAWRASD